MTLGANISVGGNLTIYDNGNTGANVILAVSTFDCIVTGDISLTGIDSNDYGQITIGASSSTGLSANDVTIGAYGSILPVNGSKITASGNWDMSNANASFATNTITSTVTLTGTGTLASRTWTANACFLQFNLCSIR